jgi:DNA-binding response OmpR family regulator
MAKILLVEDHDDIRNVLTIALTQRGHEVDAHADGESALEAIESSWPEIAIIDSRLPGVSGLELGRVIDGQTGDRKRILKVLFTGADSLAIREESHQSGFDLFASKPISIDSFCEELSQLSRESPQ